MKYCGLRLEVISCTKVGHHLGCYNSNCGHTWFRIYTPVHLW